MKKIWSTRFIVVVYCATVVIGCRTNKQEPIADKNDAPSDRQKRGMVLHISTDIPTTVDTFTPGSYEAEQASTTVINELDDNAYNANTQSNHHTTNIEQEAIEGNINEGDSPLPSSNEEEVDEIKSRKTRQKTYKCYCEEANYRSDCLKKCQSAKQFVEDDYDEDSSMEMTEDPPEAYTTKVPQTATESVKFGIPYAKTVNFDQRFVLGNKFPQSYTFYSANPHVKIPQNHLFPIYPQTRHLQYAIAYPKVVHPGIPPIKQNYLASSLKNPIAKGIYTPSTIGRNFANIQECIKLYGRTVCVIAPTTQSPVFNDEIGTTVDFITGNSMEKNINKIDDSCADNNQNQNTKSTEYPNQLIYQTNTVSPLYESKYPSVHNPKLKSSLKIDKLYSVGSNLPKLQNYVDNKQQPYDGHFNYDKKLFVNNEEIKNLPKSFNGKYYLNKNNMNFDQAATLNNNGMEKQLHYYQPISVTTPMPITQRPVYATKYQFPTTPSYAYLEEYDKSRNDHSKEIINTKEGISGIQNKQNYEYLINFENAKHGNSGQNYLQDANIRHQTIHSPYVQQSNYNAADRNRNYFESGRETTGYPVEYPTTVPISRHEDSLDSKFATNQPIYRYNKYKNNQAHSLLNGIQSVTDNRYVGSQERGFSNYENLLERTTISPFLHHTSTHITDHHKSDYQSRYDENVSSSLQKNYQKINENKYNLGKAKSNFAQGMSPNIEKDKKLFFSNGYNYNSNVKVTSSERNSHTLDYVSNSIPENHSVERATEGFNIENTLLPKSEDHDSPEFITSIRKEYDSDNLKPMSFSHDSQHIHQANHENINYYKSDSAQAKSNELSYSSNEVLKHEKYKNNERPELKFDYSNFPQSMSRIINGANGQYINSQDSQYRPGNIVQKYPNNHVYDSNDKNVHSSFNENPHSTQYIYKPTLTTPYVVKTIIPKTNPPDSISYVHQNIPTYRTTLPTLFYNNKAEAAKNEGNYYSTTYPSNYEHQDRYNTRLPLHFQNTQIPDVKLNSQFESNAYASKTNSNLFQDTVKSITTLTNLEGNEYKKHYYPVRTSTVRSMDDPTIGQSRMKYPSSLSKKKMRLNMFNDTENLFRGLEKIILKNYDPVLSGESISDSIESSVRKESTQTDSKKIAEQILFGNLNEQIKENVQNYGKTGVSEIESNKSNVKISTGTENPIQSVDDIPVTVRENIYSELTTQATYINNKMPQQDINDFLVQNTIRKVINNFVPGKAEDLMANYGNEKAKEMVGAKVSDLFPEIVGTPIIGSLLGVPEIENMIIDVAAGLLGRMTHIALRDLTGHIKKSFRKVVVNEIPRPNPTLAPFTVEEHRLQGGEWITEKVSLLGNSKTEEASLPKEVFNKIKSILNRSKVSAEEAAQPIVQNLIVKAVKHSLDKERGIVQESAIRKAFKIIVKPMRGKNSWTSASSDHEAPSAEEKKANIPKSEEDASPGSYKLAPVVPITEYNFNNGQWKESKKLLVDTKRKQISADFDKNAKQAIQSQLDKVKKIKVTSEEKEDHKYTEVSSTNFETSSEYEFGYEDENENEYESEYSVIAGNAKKNVTSNNTYDEDRQPIKYYSPNDRVLEYLKMHQDLINPNFSTTAEIIGRKNEDLTNTPISDTVGGHSSLNYEPEITETPLLQNSYPEQSNRNQLNLLFEAPKDFLKPKNQIATNDGRNFGQNNQYFGNPSTEYSSQSANNLQTYMGRLVPVDDKASNAQGLSDLQNSNLVYVGDGVRLPLTIRKLPDGTFALTLSDELCKQFLQKQCPCCLPGNSNGRIVREQKSIENPTSNMSNEESERSSEIINSDNKSEYKLRRQYEEEESFKVTTSASPENLITLIPAYFDNQRELEEQIDIAPSEVEPNLYSDIYSRMRRESEEHKEIMQGEEFADRIRDKNFLENDIETSVEEKDKANLLVNDASNEKANQNVEKNEGFQIDNNDSESYETQFDYQQEEPFQVGLDVVPRMIGPYRYQQLYAKENADALRNMFYMMQRADSGE